MFKLATGEQAAKDADLMRIASCAAHTMNRFTRALKRHVTFLDDSCRNFAIFCFSLLLNCVDLHSQTVVFDLICRYFLSPREDKIFVEAKKALLALLAERPSSKEAIDRIMSKFDHLPKHIAAIRGNFKC